MTRSAENQIPENALIKKMDDHASRRENPAGYFARLIGLPPRSVPNDGTCWQPWTLGLPCMRPKGHAGDCGA